MHVSFSKDARFVFAIICTPVQPHPRRKEKDARCVTAKYTNRLTAKSMYLSVALHC